MATAGSTLQKLAHIRLLCRRNDVAGIDEFVTEWINTEAEAASAPVPVHDDLDKIEEEAKRWHRKERATLPLSVGGGLAERAAKASIPAVPAKRNEEEGELVWSEDNAFLMAPPPTPTESVEKAVVPTAKAPTVEQPEIEEEVEILAVVPPPVGKGKGKKPAEKVEVASGSGSAAGTSGMATEKPTGKEPITPAALVRSSARIKEKSAKKLEEEKKGQRP